jgi:hypothetical protein
MTVDEALGALGETTSPDYAVIILRSDRGNLTAAPVLGVALDDTSQDVSLLMGAASEEETALEDAISLGEVRDALQEAGPECAAWPLYSADAAGQPEDGDLGGSLVGFTVGDDVEIFAFLQGPQSDWDED